MVSFNTKVVMYNLKLKNFEIKDTSWYLKSVKMTVKFSSLLRF
jgi:hypothetical protein